MAKLSLCDAQCDAVPQKNSAKFRKRAKPHASIERDCIALEQSGPFKGS